MAEPKAELTVRLPADLMPFYGRFAEALRAYAADHRPPSPLSVENGVMIKKKLTIDVASLFILDRLVKKQNMTNAAVATAALRLLQSRSLS